MEIPQYTEAPAEAPDEQHDWATFDVPHTIPTKAINLEFLDHFDKDALTMYKRTNIDLFNGSNVEAIDYYMNGGDDCIVANFTSLSDNNDNQEDNLMRMIPLLRYSIDDCVIRTTDEPNLFWNDFATYTTKISHNGTYDKLAIVTVAPPLDYTVKATVEKKIKDTIFASIVTQFFHCAKDHNCKRVLIMDVVGWYEKTRKVINFNQYSNATYMEHIATFIATVFLSNPELLSAYTRICFPIPIHHDMHDVFNNVFTNAITNFGMNATFNDSKLARGQVPPPDMGAMEYLYVIYESEEYNVALGQITNCRRLNKSMMNFFPVCRPKNFSPEDISKADPIFIPNYKPEFSPRYIFDTDEQVFQFVEERMFARKYINLVIQMAQCIRKNKMIGADDDDILRHISASVSLMYGAFAPQALWHTIAQYFNDVVDYFAEKRMAFGDPRLWIEKKGFTHVQSNDVQFGGHHNALNKNVKYISSKLLRNMMV